MKKQYQDMELIDLQRELYNQNELLKGMAKEIQLAGEELARLNKLYDLEYGRLSVELKSHGEPATTLRKTIETQEKMVNMAFDCEIAKLKYEAKKRSVNHIELTIDVLRSLISIEKAKMGL